MTYDGRDIWDHPDDWQHIARCADLMRDAGVPTEVGTDAYYAVSRVVRHLAEVERILTERGES